MCISRHTLNFSILNQTKGDPKRMTNKNKNTTGAVNSVSAFQAELKVRMA